MGDIAIIQWVDSHGILCLAIMILLNCLVGYLPTPTKDSSKIYLYFFQVSNSLMLSLARAFHSKVENSPNWSDAVEKHIASKSNNSIETKNSLFLGGGDK